ncbi:DnaJ protein [Thecamonas trahens ATCC 50062]|uniref:DnaJ protein n=1 Tax=Thecamonas trahens ATCC 50062 TaxID=461836 RepID=A0A0L0DJM7_THETB|nr:DnaJ protein [Thecamonas trahens ATCC 50062]KNC52609.1 DnaJ protein [Thecamonas trahens ATCC 50062]|eukprot:XP_013755168.1 DnaJ protein [Thecamonas trahens ATCC 50062]
MAQHRELYDVLGVEPDTPTPKIRKAYMKLAKKYHPDRNPGDEEAAEKMKEISAAWDVLQDDEKRAQYDRFGLEGLQGAGGPGAGGFADIFDLFGGGRSRGPPTKTPDMKHGLGVELADLYKGRKRKLRITRSVLCTPCGGKGGVDGKEAKSCRSCNGQGVKVMMRQIGPGMVQQMHVPCDACSGEGELLDAADRCPECSGRKLMEKSEDIEINVRPGMRHGESIVLRGKANEAPGLETGDIVFVVQEMEDERFERRGDDLFMKMKLSLIEALTGFEFNITTLDDRELLVKALPGQIIAPNQIIGVPDEGMPRNKNPALRGNLFIEFSVTFPDVLPVEVVDQLRQILPEATRPKAANPNAEEVHLTVKHVEGQSRQAYDEDEHGHGGGGGGGVQCAQQ